MASNQQAASNSGMKAICDDMIYYCFDVLHSVLHTNKDPPKPSFPNNEYPLFVTWYIGRELNLRGCIGTFSPMALHDGLTEYSKISAFQDSRFNPISKVARYIFNRYSLFYI